MALKKLIKETKSLEAAIQKGGALPDSSSKGWSYFPLRLRRDLSEDIQSRLEKRIGMSKTAWILEAIQEKLNKE